MDAIFKEIPKMQIATARDFGVSGPLPPSQVPLLRVLARPIA